MKINRRQFLGQTLILSAAGYCPSVFADINSDKAREWNAILSGHRLDALETKTVQLNWPRLVGKNSRLDVHGRGLRETVCRIKTDKGAVGWGVLHEAEWHCRH